MRIGMGYDVHRLVEGRDLFMGGVKIEYEKGLLGHSDADVLVHAIMDALLGAAGMGDIGKHFPDNDPQYKGISSIALLKKVKKSLLENKYVISNIDATIIAQAPKMGPHIEEMKRTMAKALAISPDRINIKATTEEMLGFTGRGEGISANAIALIETPTNIEPLLHELNAIDYSRLHWYFSLRQAGTCESMLVDNYLWKYYYDTRYIMNDKGIMLVMEIKDDTFTNVPLCRAEDLQECFYDIQRYFNEVLGQKLKLYLADEEAIEELKLPTDKYIIEEDRRYFDYVYDAEKLRTLSGKAYHKKKNHVNGFLKEYEGRYEFRILECSDVDEIMEFLRKWEEDRGIEDEYNRVDYELMGIENVIKNCKLIKFMQFGIYIDGKLEAFSLGSYSCKEEMAYIHIEKANPNIRGLYTFINQQFLVNVFPDAKKVNREDDMGIEGLRKAKMSYHPIELVKKYNIIQK